MVLAQKEKEILIQTIAKKKELRHIDVTIIRKALQKVLLQQATLTKKLLPLHEKSAAFKQVVKLTRAQLRRSTGLFQTATKERSTLLNTLLSSNLTKKDVIPLLETHASTKERLPFYEQLYKILFSKTTTIYKILDVGCGLNPLSVPFTKKKKLLYHAYDINKKEITLLNTFFQAYQQKFPQFQAKAAIADMRSLKITAAYDVTILFKVTDILDQNKGHKATEQLITQLNTKYVLLSFPTVTMSNKPMRAPERRWVRLLCQRLGYQVDAFSSSNEIFYLIEK